MVLIALLSLVSILLSLDTGWKKLRNRGGGQLGEVSILLSLDTGWKSLTTETQVLVLIVSILLSLDTGWKLSSSPFAGWPGCFNPLKSGYGLEEITGNCFDGFCKVSILLSLDTGWKHFSCIVSSLQLLFQSS